MPSSGALALIAGLADFVPFVGPILGAIPALVMAATQSMQALLITLGAVLSLALIAAESVPWDDVDGGLGDRTFAPTSAEGVRSSYDGGVGDMTIDLSDVDVSDLDEPIRTTVEHGLGDVAIVLPRDADVEVAVDVGVGEVSIFGRDGLTEGTFEGTGAGSWVGDDEPEIVLDVDSGLGDVEVTRG